MFLDYFYYNLYVFLNFFFNIIIICRNFVLSIFVLECFIMPNMIFSFFFYIMNINIYNLFYICTLACIWALFLRINLFVFVFVFVYRGTVPILSIVSGKCSI